MGPDYRELHPSPKNIFWVIEYSDSSLNKDLEVKSKVYGKAGIPEYWILNLRSRQVIVLRMPTDEGYQCQEVLTEGEINPVSFPDVTVAIARLFGG